MREKFSAGQIDAALYLLARARASPAEWTILIADQVNIELTQHMDSVEQESRTAIDRIGRAMGIFATHRLIDDVASVTSAIRRFPAEARGVVEQFIAAAQITKGRQALYRLAYDRISANIRPARRGKDSAKDCLILETYLEVVTRLRAGGFTEPVAFLTTNSDDYGERGIPNRLHPDLAADFTNTAMDYYATFLATRFGLFPHRA
jgi:hypothetical protein